MTADGQISIMYLGNLSYGSPRRGQPPTHQRHYC